MECGRSGRAVNIKKGQFLAPWDARHAIEKARAAGAREVLITERGASFGYNNLVVDFKSIPILRGMGVVVVFDGKIAVEPKALGDNQVMWFVTTWIDA